MSDILRTDPYVFKNYFSTLNISGSGLHTQRKRLDMIAMNLANINTIKTDEGGPYKRKVFIQKARHEDIFDHLLEEKSLTLDKNNELHFQIDKYGRVQVPTELRGVDGEIKEDGAEPILVYDPYHPEANEQGYIEKPNINVTTEMVDMISAQKEYEANIAAITAYKEFAKNALNI